MFYLGGLFGLLGLGLVVGIAGYLCCCCFLLLILIAVNSVGLRFVFVFVGYCL